MMDYAMCKTPPEPKFRSIFTQTNGGTDYQFHTLTHDKVIKVAVSNSDKEYPIHHSNSVKPRNRFERRSGAQVNSNSIFLRG